MSFFFKTCGKGSGKKLATDSLSCNCELSEKRFEGYCFFLHTTFNPRPGQNGKRPNSQGGGWWGSTSPPSAWSGGYCHISGITSFRPQKSPALQPGVFAILIASEFVKMQWGVEAPTRHSPSALEAPHWHIVPGRGKVVVFF